MDFISASCSSDSISESSVSPEAAKRTALATRQLEKCINDEGVTPLAGPSRQRIRKSDIRRKQKTKRYQKDVKRPHRSKATRVLSETQSESDSADESETLTSELPQMIQEMRKVCQHLTNFCSVLESSMNKPKRQKTMLKQSKKNLEKIKETVSKIPLPNLSLSSKRSSSSPILDDTSEEFEENTSSVDYSGPSCGSPLLDSIKDEFEVEDSVIEDNIFEIFKDGQLDLDAVPSSASSILKSLSALEELDLDDFEEPKCEPQDNSDDDVIFVSETIPRKGLRSAVVIKVDPDNVEKQKKITDNLLVSQNDANEQHSSVSASNRTRRKRTSQLQLTDFFEHRSKQQPHLRDTEQAAPIPTRTTLDEDTRFQVVHTARESRAKIAPVPKPSSEHIPIAKSNDRLMMKRDIEQRLRVNDLSSVTQRAIREENSRVRQVFRNNELLQRQLAGNKDSANQLILDHDQKENIFICVHPRLVDKMKEHQREGVKFMYDCCYGSISDAKASKCSGCILAHCMGLGKTFQVITLVHTAINCPRLKTKRVIVVCPKSTVMNWVHEIQHWLSNIDSNVKLRSFFLPDAANIYKKMEILRDFYKLVGNDANCLIIGYEAYRSLVFFDASNKHGKQHSEAVRTEVRKYLVNPGADLIVLDEGHVIKNPKSQINLAVSEVATRRRIILTGTPIQNNLSEYFCMVSFVKPAFLGNEKEFNEQFAKPIRDGQHKDSNVADIRIMKMKSFILHKRMSNFVQRKGLSVLQDSLPQKYEYVLYIPLTEVQEKLYEQYLKRNPFRKDVGGGCLLEDYSFLRKIWTHPTALQQALETAEKKKPDDVDNARSITNVWWKQIISEDDLKSLIPSNKLLLLFEILKQCQERGEKCLIFSGYVMVLNTVEHFMKMIDKQSGNPKARAYGFSRFRGPWRSGIDYYRIDGASSLANRQDMITKFNDPQNHVTRAFLISTKAGGLGINLVGANRVIILDTSWNPAVDQQGIHRVYRLGQEKTCYIYRLLAFHTMEEKVYSRAVTKQAMSHRVADKKQVDRKYNMAELEELYHFERVNKIDRPTLAPAEDDLLSTLLLKHDELIYKYHTHERMLDNTTEQDLTDLEKEVAWEEFKKKGQIVDCLDVDGAKDAGDLSRTSTDVVDSNNNVTSSAIGNTEEQSIVNQFNATLSHGIYSDENNEVSNHLPSGETSDISVDQNGMFACSETELSSISTMPIIVGSPFSLSNTSTPRFKYKRMPQPTILLKKLDITLAASSLGIEDSTPIMLQDNLCRSIVPYNNSSVECTPLNLSRASDQGETNDRVPVTTGSSFALVPYVKRRSLLDDNEQHRNFPVRSDSLSNQANNDGLGWSQDVTPLRDHDKRYDTVSISTTRIKRKSNDLLQSFDLRKKAKVDGAATFAPVEEETHVDCSEPACATYIDEDLRQCDSNQPETFISVPISATIGKTQSCEKHPMSNVRKSIVKHKNLHSLQVSQSTAPCDETSSALQTVKLPSRLSEVGPVATSVTLSTCSAMVHVGTSTSPDLLLGAAAPFIRYSESYQTNQCRSLVPFRSGLGLCLESNVEPSMTSKLPESRCLAVIPYIKRVSLVEVNPLWNSGRTGIKMIEAVEEWFSTYIQNENDSSAVAVYRRIHSLWDQRKYEELCVLSQTQPIIRNQRDKRFRFIPYNKGDRPHQSTVSFLDERVGPCFLDCLKQLMADNQGNSEINFAVHNHVGGANNCEIDACNTVPNSAAERISSKPNCLSNNEMKRKLTISDQRALNLSKRRKTDVLNTQPVQVTNVAKYVASQPAINQNHFYLASSNEDMSTLEQSSGADSQKLNKCRALVPYFVKLRVYPEFVNCLEQMRRTTAENRDNSCLAVVLYVKRVSLLEHILANDSKHRQVVKYPQQENRSDGTRDEAVCYGSSLRDGSEVSTTLRVMEREEEQPYASLNVIVVYKSNIFEIMFDQRKDAAVAVYRRVHSLWDQHKYEEIQRRTKPKVPVKCSHRYRFIPYDRCSRTRLNTVSSLDEGISNWFADYLKQLNSLINNHELNSNNRDLNMTLNSKTEKQSVSNFGTKRKAVMESPSSIVLKRRKSDPMNFQLELSKQIFTTFSNKSHDIESSTISISSHTNKCRALVPYRSILRMQPELVLYLQQMGRSTAESERPENTCFALVPYVERVSLLEHILTNYHENRQATNSSSQQRENHFEDSPTEAVPHEVLSQTTTCSFPDDSDFFANFCDSSQEDDEHSSSVIEPTMMKQSQNDASELTGQHSKHYFECHTRQNRQIIRIQRNKCYRFVPYNTENRIHRFPAENVNLRFNEYVKQLVDEKKISPEVAKYAVPSNTSDDSMAILPYTGNTILNTIHEKIFSRPKSAEFHPELVNYLTICRKETRQSVASNQSLKRKLQLDNTSSMTRKKVKVSEITSPLECYHTAKQEVSQQVIQRSSLADSTNILRLSPERPLPMVDSNRTVQESIKRGLFYKTKTWFTGEKSSSSSLFSKVSQLFRK